MDKVFTLGPNIARINNYENARDRAAPVLSIFQPSYGEDGVYFPASEVVVAGALLIRELADALTPFATQKEHPGMAALRDDRDDLWERWVAITTALGYDSPNGTSLGDEHGVLAHISRLQAMASQARSQTP